MNIYKRIARTLRLASNLDHAEKYHASDKIVEHAIRIAQDAPEFTPGTELQSGQQYKVPADESNMNVINQVAETGKPNYATVGGEKVLITHGDPSGFWLLPDSAAATFFNNNPDFKASNVLSDVDQNAGIQANFEQGKNRLWINAPGMQKYAGAKWLGCHDLINGKGAGQYGGAKGAIEVTTQKGPDGQQMFVQSK